MTNQQARVAVIGGSGVYDIDGLENKQTISVDTPWGKPSDDILLGTMDGIEVAFLPRHGRGHFLSPTDVPYLANIYALRELGVQHVLTATAVGSLREHTPPGTFVFVDQYIDRTYRRRQTFFGDGVVAHVPMADPVCSAMVDVLEQCSQELKLNHHRGGTYICIEGPQFSTRAESEMYRQWGADIIGMTNITEAKLIREAGMSFASIAMVTDFDCWHPDHEDVDVAQVIATAHRNAGNVVELLKMAVPRLGELPDSEWRSVLDGAIMTAPDLRDADALLKLQALLND
ncbi:MAG: S-methyl-5'-thioadenosine phosphorylase [Planctomycetes bacterium]|nr:S-methyl-5'-thioadenosine phosphorylase [Planctomycetota bacterium]